MPSWESIHPAFPLPAGIKTHRCINGKAPTPFDAGNRRWARKIVLKTALEWMALMNVYPVAGRVNCFFGSFRLRGGGVPVSEYRNKIFIINYINEVKATYPRIFQVSQLQKTQAVDNFGTLLVIGKPVGEHGRGNRESRWREGFVARDGASTLVGRNDG